VEVTASQPGDSAYNPANHVSQFVMVTKSPQIISIVTSPGIISESSQIVAFSTSGLPVDLILGTGSAADSLVYHSEGYYTLRGIQSSGEIYLIGNQAGNDNYYPAEQVIDTISINRYNQVIYFDSINNKLYADNLTDTLRAVSSSGLPVTFSVISGPATIQDSIIYITGSGIISVAASQSGNDSVNPATSVFRTFEVYKISSEIIFDDIVVTYGNPFLKIEPVSDSPGSFDFYSSNDHIFVMQGDTAWIMNAGVAQLTIFQNESDNYNAAFKVISLTVLKANPIINITPYEVTYDGLSHEAFGTAYGVEQPTPLNLSSY
jgi:hypothetical protein